MKQVSCCLLLFAIGSSMAADPIPLRRAVVTPEQLAAELARAERGTLVRLKRADFEARVQQAADGLEQRGRPPQLLRAEYAARIDGEQLIGTAKWTIRNDASSSARLSMEPMSAAVRSAKWSDGSDAIIGPFDGANSGWLLLVEGTGVKTLVLEWSARGLRQPDGVQFDLRWPAAGIATCEWNLPIDQVPVASNDSCQYMGLRPFGDNRRTWSFAVGGSTQFSFLITPHQESKPFWFVKQRHTCRIQTDRVHSEIQLDVATSPGRSNTLELEIDPKLLVADITAPDLTKWKALDGNRIQLSFADPIADTTITIHAATIPGEGQAWICPAIAVVGGVTGGEVIVLEVPADVSFEDFRPGAFRLIDGRVAENGQQELTLESMWAKRTETGRPNGRIRAASGSVDVSERHMWDITPDRQSLSCRLLVRPIHESLANWSIALPTLWNVDSVECKSSPAMRWSIRRGGNDQQVLYLEFDRPLPVGSAVPISIEYRGRAPALLGSTVPFPDPEPARARSRSVQMQIGISPLFDVEARPGPFAVVNADVVGPQPDSSANVSFHFPMGRVVGDLMIRSRPPRFTASGAGRLRVRNDDLVCEYRVIIRPERGALSAVTFMATAPAIGNGEWRASSGAMIRRVQRIDPIGQWAASNAGTVGVLESLAGLVAIGHGGAIWQVVFDRPVHQTITLDYSEVLRREPEWGSVIARSLLCLGGYSMISDAVPTLLPAAMNPLVAPALWTVAGATTQEHTWRYFDLSRRTQPPAEWRSVSGVPTIRYLGQSPSTVIDMARHRMRRLSVSEARITASITGDDRIVVRYQAAVRGAGGSRVPLELPIGAQLLEARASGHDISAIFINDRRIEFDLPADAAILPVEIVYTMPGIGVWPVGRLIAPAPRWAGDMGATLWSWQLPIGWEACSAGRGDVPATNSPALTNRTDPNVQVFPGDGPTLWVTQPLAFRRACWLMATLALALALAWQPRWALALAVLFVLGLAWFLLPPPLRALPLGPILVFALMLIWQRWPHFHWRRQSATATLMTLALAISMSGADPKPRTVLIVPAKDQEPETVFAPTDLLAKLDELASPNQVAMKWIIQSANYQTTIRSQQVETQAVWTIDSLQAGGEFIAPIAGSDLMDLKVDEQAAIPTIQQGQLRIALPKKGKVVVSARLLAKTAERAGERSIVCSIPPSLRAQWTIDYAKDLRLLPSPSGTGAIAKSDGRWVVDLGRAKTLQCAWQTTPANATPITIQETYLWDLRQPAARLFAILKCQKPAMDSNEWRIDVPAELTAVEVRTINPEQLVTWRHEGENKNTMTIQMAGSMEPIVAVVEFAPSQSLNTALPLPIPACHGVSETLVAWRGGPDVRPGPIRGFVAIPEDAFRRDWLAPTNLDDAALPTRAWRKSITANDPFVRVNLGPMPIWKGEPNILWQLGPRRAEVTAKLALACDSSKLPFVECDVPATVTIAQVTGDHVAQWTRAGTRLQIWLDQPQSETTIEVRGWINRNAEAARFDVPVIRWLNVTPGVQLSITARPGWELTPINAQQLTAQNNPKGQERLYHGDRSNYRLIVQPRATHRAADYRVNTSVNMLDGRPSAQTTIEARSANAGLGSQLVMMTVAPGDEVTWQAPDLQVTEQPTLPGRRLWLVEPLRATSNKWYLHFQVVGHAATRSWTVPKVELKYSGSSPAKWDMGIQVGPGIRAIDAGGLDQISSTRWRADNDRWQMEVEINAGQLSRP